nr:immunoglobulin heavy chain junction region [Macaca mulatta]MOV87338.1 immunoglobulin heavy chain junction region [Macaca mulatta]MOV88154.1 immunoglobulin heavy chain junction region [Macaca mulatta]MOV88700.1 immunoglobulin heavy chain junction region [Macaca mulatta]MOV88762.1 immunoglobulin heavy chain junction region [Macaca mulatta]
CARLVVEAIRYLDHFDVW